MRQITRQFLLTLLFLPAVLSASAQGSGMVRGNCTPSINPDEAMTARGQMQQSALALQQPSKNWDASKVYRQMVILVTFSDKTFTTEDPNQYYNRMFNEPGYNEGAGVGCMADYFREQSSGMFNLQFDIYGPYQVESEAQPYDKPTSSTTNYGGAVLREAAQKMVDDNPDLDYKQYDWNGNGAIDQVIFVYAGLSGNQGPGSYGHIWPNSSSFSTIKAPDGTAIQSYCCNGEMYIDNTLFGIGTLCHEFSHTLGLPDLYPTSSTSKYYSVVDEWDLMDGGNYTNKGWCPPNYTALEKMLMGWLTPIELTEPTTITDLKPVAEGGEAYVIEHTANEYLLLENRQWMGWDAGLPGRGLVIYHVDYSESAWINNRVNVTDGHFRFDLIHADNLDYEQWNTILSRTYNQYAEQPMMHNKHLSTSSYPWTPDTTAFINNELTDSSVPATKMFNENAESSNMLSKAITNIQMSADGLISFDFMGGTPSAISTVPTPSANGNVYNIMGQRTTAPRKGLFIKNGKKYIIH